MTSERWAVKAEDGHTLELLVEAPEQPFAALLFGCAMGDLGGHSLGGQLVMLHVAAARPDRSARVRRQGGVNLDAGLGPHALGA